MENKINKQTKSLLNLAINKNYSTLENKYYLDK